MGQDNFINDCSVAINDFKKSIKKEPFKSFLNCELDENTQLEVFCAAVYQGYLDACRTFSKSEVESWHNENDGKTKALAEKIQQYLQEEGKGFKHNDLCTILTSGSKITYGHAQKIVNMAFKYLCCLNGAENYSDKFAECHMPLDSIMLEWIVRYYESKYVNKDDRILRGKVPSWSAMELEDGKKYNGYNFFVGKVYDICQATKKTPLQLDFEYWREMQLRLSAEAFLKAYYQEDDDNQGSSRKYANKLKTEEYKELVEEVNEKTKTILNNM